ncbi:hypothetical protein JTB14_001574 [Gonioctena quinquepunctata]|nr:hypothetical protein JTB14_001574 [Gonioctena quinquepunctata]
MELSLVEMNNNLELETSTNKLVEFQPTANKSYSDVVKNYQSSKVCNTSLILKPKSIQSASKTKLDLQGKIKPKNLNIVVNSIRQMKYGEKAIKCRTEGEIVILKEEIHKKLNNNYDSGK